MDFSTFPSHRRMCFYPSSGYRLLWAVMKLEADLFVFSDKEREHSSWVAIEADFAQHGYPLRLVQVGRDFVEFRSGNKTGVLLWEDNNLVLDRFYQNGLRVHHFVGICDGCSEGGNYECVHDRAFVRRLIRVSADGMLYSTDHSRPLQGFKPHDGWGMLHTKKFLERLALSDFPDHSKGHRAPRWGEPSFVPSASFELEGVLIRREDQVASCRFEVLLKGQSDSTQLDALRPFRELTGCGRIAEYRVNLR